MLVAGTWRWFILVFFSELVCLGVGVVIVERGRFGAGGVFVGLVFFAVVTC